MQYSFGLFWLTFILLHIHIISQTSVTHGVVIERNNRVKNIPIALIVLQKAFQHFMYSLIKLISYYSRLL